MTNTSAFFDEFIGTTVLMFVVLAINDKKNEPPPAGLAPSWFALFFLDLTVLGIWNAFGMQTGTLFLQR